MKHREVLLVMIRTSRTLMIQLLSQARPDGGTAEETPRRFIICATQLMYDGSIQANVGANISTLLQPLYISISISISLEII